MGPVMAASNNDANPSDEEVERSIKNQRKSDDKHLNSIIPQFLEEDIVRPKENRGKGANEDLQDEDFEELSSDKEENTTEGELTDTHTSD